MTANETHVPNLDSALLKLARNRQRWLETPVAERIALLARIKECLMPVAQRWAETAAAQKGIAPDSELTGEEWISGPYTVMSYCNQMMATLSAVKDKHHLDQIPVRLLPNGQVAARVLPHSIWDHLLLSGVKVDVWMDREVTPQNLRAHTASIYDPASPNHKQGKVALVLGAGNIAAIAPLDVFHKLFAENQVVILKMNPVNDYLIEFLTPALKPLIDLGVLEIVRGGTDVGQYLCNHPLVDEIHITGSVASHDAIVWGTGAQAAANKAANTPVNNRHITSELGAVCPTIVVGGQWSNADLLFQAEQIATQKLHNSGFNCVACQVLIVPKQWRQRQSLLDELKKVMSAAEKRALYYPGVEQRLEKFKASNPGAKNIRDSIGSTLLVSELDPSSTSILRDEVFAPAMNVMELDATDPADYLKQAIEYANSGLFGTLGANIVIHPKTVAAIGRKRFETLLLDLKYGTIAINAWTGLGFLSPQATWGAFPGESLPAVQSGIGVVHNTCLFDRPERTVVEAPFRPFPRNLMSLSFTLLPRPPWFITNKRGNILGKLLVKFQYRPSLLKLPRIFFNALLG